MASGAADAETLLGQRDRAGKTVQELLDEANATIGEKIEVRRVARARGRASSRRTCTRPAPTCPPQIGVLVAVDGGDAAVARDVAMHIAAFSPSVLTREEVPAETVENERRVAEETAREEGKPEAALPKIVEGRVNGFFKENVLLEQAFAKDTKKTVGKVLEEAGVKATRASRASGSAPERRPPERSGRRRPRPPHGGRGLSAHVTRVEPGTLPWQTDLTPSNPARVEAP